jgi:uncharacterized protein YndB with AHSA1/START domain
MTSTSTATSNASSSVAHATFVVERTFDAPLDRVWDAFAVPEQHARWFGADPGFTETEAHEDFRVGGRPSRTVSGTTAPPAATSAPTPTSSSARGSSPPTTCGWREAPVDVVVDTELEAVDGGTRVTYTEQASSWTAPRTAASARRASGASSRPSRRTWRADPLPEPDRGAVMTTMTAPRSGSVTCRWGRRGGPVRVCG